MKTIAIIPARYASNRLPGKPLLDLDGKTLIRRVYERVQQADIGPVVVATDHTDIAAEVRSFGGKVVLTRSDHPSGTDRIAEALDALLASGESVDLVLNVQGDEPFVDTDNLRHLVAIFRERPEAGIATLATRFRHPDSIHNPNQVKVVMDVQGRALYFSRYALPYQRGKDPRDWSVLRPYYRHLGTYGFRAEVLKRVVTYPVSGLEKAESLEQLRWLEHGEPIYVKVVEDPCFGIDTPEDLDRARQLLHQMHTSE